MASPREPTKPLAVIEDDHGAVAYEDSSAPPAAAYVFEPLPTEQHFRLLKLEPGRFNDKLKCEIITYELDGQGIPPFDAVSYTWNESRFDRLLVNGQRVAMEDPLRKNHSVRHPLWCLRPDPGSTKSPQRSGAQRTSERLLISTNLRDMLRRFRDPTNSHMLWIDALCIQQSDLDERASQILQMQRIYHVAKQVLFWLGEADKESEDAFRLARQLQKVVLAVDSRKMKVPAPSALYERSSTDSYKLPPYPSSPDWAALMKLFDRPVFARIWIVQELVAARETLVRCGDLPSMAFQVLLDAVRLLQGTGWIGPIASKICKGVDNTQFLPVIPNVKIDWMREPTLEIRTKQRKKLVRSTRIFAATDPRDKVYALIGLINDYGHRDVHGADRPESSATSTSKNAGSKAKPSIKIHAGGKSDSDLAIDILHQSHDDSIVKFRQVLIQWLNSAVDIVNGILHPSASTHTKEFNERVVGAITGAVDYYVEFDEKFSRKSKAHERVHQFAGQTLNMFNDHVTNIYTIVLETSPEDLRKVLEGPSGHIIIEENARLLDNLQFFLDCLTKVPDGKGGFEGDLPTQELKGLQIGLVGSRDVFDTQDVSVRIEKQFQDWAWSAAGWTVPDYRKNVVDVYIEFAVKCMRDDQTLDMLTTVEDVSARKVQGLPSWVPDFTVPFERHQLQRFDRDEKPLYSAAGTSTINVGWNMDNPTQLDVEGYRFDRIQRLAGIETAKEAVSHALMQKWQAFIQPLPATYVGGGRTKEAFWRTLIGDCSDHPDMTSPAPERCRAQYVALGERLELEAALAAGTADLAELVARGRYSVPQIIRMQADSDEFLAAMAAVMLQRRLAVTDRGYLAAVPISAQPGDELVLLKGGAVPFVLRPPTERPATRRLIGECYVHGVMHGELLAEKDFAWANIILS